MPSKLPDTIYDKKKFVKSLPAEYDGIFDWSWVEGIFPRGIMPTDVDGMIELHGHFFIFETKGTEFTMVPRGQLYLIEALLRTGYFTVMIVWGDEVEKWTMYTSKGNISGEGKNTAIHQLARWRDYVLSTFDRYGNKTKGN